MLKHRELERLRVEIEAAGKTIVPLRLYFKNALIKVELAVGAGKNLRDKRQDLKKEGGSERARPSIKKFIEK